MSAFVFEREIIATLANVRQAHESAWTASCPVVPDHELSLMVGIAPLARSDGGRTGLLLRCDSCRPQDVQAAITGRLNGTPVDWRADGRALRALSGVEGWYEATKDGTRGRFIPPRAASWLKAHGHILHGTDGRLYRYDDGVYKPDAVNWLAVKLRELEGESFREQHVSEVIAWQEAHEQIEIGFGDPEIINLANGRLVWRTGELLPHSPDLITSVKLPVVYDPGATCPTIDRFLDDVMSTQLQALVEEIAGLLLVPDNRYRKAFLLVGDGQNGKSVTLRLLGAPLGDTGISKVSLQDLSASRFAAAELQSKYANICGDIDYRAIEDSSMFKKIVGGDAIAAERKYGQPFAFLPAARLLFSANTLPASSDTTPAFFDRWIVIPFKTRIPDDKVDPRLSDRMLTPRELSGWLNRAVAGLRRLDARGHFRPPQEATQALDDYRASIEPVSAFTDAMLIVDGNRDSMVSRSDMYRVFSNWSANSGHRPILSEREFVKRLRETGLPLGETRHASGRYWTGVRFVGQQRLAA